MKPILIIDFPSLSFAFKVFSMISNPQFPSQKYSDLGPFLRDFLQPYWSRLDLFDSFDLLDRQALDQAPTNRYSKKPNERSLSHFSRKTLQYYMEE